MKNTQKLTIVTAVLLQLVGCSARNSTSGGGSRAPSAAGPTISVSYLAAAPNPQIDIVATNFSPLASAELVLSDGRNVHTEAIQREFAGGGGGGVCARASGSAASAVQAADLAPVSGSVFRSAVQRHRPPRDQSAHALD